MTSKPKSMQMSEQANERTMRPGDEKAQTTGDAQIQSDNGLKQSSRGGHGRVPRICFVSSSGGHWEQLQKLQPLADKYSGFFVTERTKFDAPKADFFMIQTDLKDRWMLFKMAWNALYALIIWIRRRPDFVITTGTMVAYPFYLLATLLRKKFVFIETFGRMNMPTVAGKRMEKHTDLFIVQWESQKRFYKNAVYVGCLY